MHLHIVRITVVVHVCACAPFSLAWHRLGACWAVKCARAGNVQNVIWLELKRRRARERGTTCEDHVILVAAFFDGGERS